MTLHSKISKIIDIQFQNNSHSTLFFEWSVNYFGNFEAECHLLKIGFASLVSLNVEGVNVIYQKKNYF